MKRGLPARRHKDERHFRVVHAAAVVCRGCAEARRDDFLKIVQRRIRAVALDQLGEGQSPAALAPGTG